MAEAQNLNLNPQIPTRVSYWFILGTIVLVGWLHLATPLLAILFAYLALTRACCKSPLGFNGKLGG